MPWITKEGRTVEEAHQAAVAAAGVPESELDIEVVSEGAKGLFGLGGEPAVVRVRPRDEATDVRHAFRDDITPARDESPPPAAEEPAPREQRSEPAAESEVNDEGEDRVSIAERQEQAAALGAEIVRGILDRMNLEGDINTRVAGGTVYVEVFGEEMGLLIGRSGATLEALQELVRAGVQRRLRTRQAVVVDVEAYWERRRAPRREGGGGERRSGGGGGNRRRGRSGGGGRGGGNR